MLHEVQEENTVFNKKLKIYLPSTLFDTKWLLTYESSLVGKYYGQFSTAIIGKH